MGVLAAFTVKLLAELIEAVVEWGFVCTSGGAGGGEPSGSGFWSVAIAFDRGRFTDFVPRFPRGNCTASNKESVCDKSCGVL